MLLRILKEAVLLPCDVIYDSFYGVWTDPMATTRTRQRLSNIYDDIDKPTTPHKEPE